MKSTAEVYFIFLITILHKANICLSDVTQAFTNANMSSQSTTRRVVTRNPDECYCDNCHLDGVYKYAGLIGSFFIGLVTGIVLIVVIGVIIRCCCYNKCKTTSDQGMSVSFIKPAED